MSFCNKCGCKLEEEARFCPNCGTEVVLFESKAESVDNSVTQPVQQAQTMSSIEKLKPADGSSKPKGKKRGLLIAGLCVLSIALIGGGVCAAFIAKKALDNLPEESNGEQVYETGSTKRITESHESTSEQRKLQLYKIEHITNWDENGNVFYKQTKKYDPRGNLIYFLYEYPNGKVISQCESVYDENNRKIREVYFDTDGSEASRFEFEYDFNGNEIRAIMYQKGEVTTLYENKYNSAGQIVSKDNGLERTVYEYDEAGNQIKETHYIDGKMFYKYVNEYNSDGKIVLKTKYNDNEETVEYIGYEYDTSGRLTKEETFSRHGSSQSYTINVYDSKGRLIRIDNDFIKTIFEYDENGNETMKAVYKTKDGSLFFRFERRFDNEGKEIEEDYYDCNGKLASHSDFEYAYK